jgi:hypothetical protein
MKINRLQKNKIGIILVIVCIFFVSKLSYAQTWIQTLDQVKNNTQQITNIEDKILDLKDNYQLLYDGAKDQNNQLSNQISFAGYLLGGFSFILTIFGFFLALFINRQYEKIKEMKDIVENTKKYIDKHSEDLYKRIKRNETVDLLNRLKEIPEDITNICPLLLSRNLLEEDFLCLKDSYLKTKNNTFDRGVSDQYVILLTQHFPYESLKDIDTKTDIISYINGSLLRNMFNCDVENLFDQVFKYLKETGINSEENKTIIKKLFYHFYKSKFYTNIKLRESIKEIIFKSRLSLIDISSIAKEQSPTDTVYTTWLDLIFSQKYEN